MARKYHQGRFTPKNPEKYMGDINNIIYRSGWELKVLKWADANPSVLKYASEEIVIPYYSPVDNKVHRYFVDFVFQMKNRAGETKNYLVEVKPKSQTVPPKKRNRQSAKYLDELATYAVNQAKWKEATAWCEKRNMQFVVLTEDHIKP